MPCVIDRSFAAPGLRHIYVHGIYCTSYLRFYSPSVRLRAGPHLLSHHGRQPRFTAHPILQCILKDGAHKSAGVRDVHALRRPVLGIRTQYRDIVLAGSICPLILSGGRLFVLILQHAFLLSALRRSAHLAARAAFSINRSGWLVCLAGAKEPDERGEPITSRLAINCAKCRQMSKASSVKRLHPIERTSF